jgi:SpoVK/Ycf46/Vps4 family AAA+-type ATPase
MTFNNKCIRAVDSAESRYAKGKTAEWLLNLMESKIFINEPFLHCLEWILGGFQNILLEIEDSLKTALRKREFFKVRRELQDLLLKSRREIQIYDDIDDFMRKYPCMDEMIQELIRGECAAAAKVSKEESAVYLQARKKLRRTFGLDENACTICEFLFIKDKFDPVEEYFEHALEIFKFAHRKDFADMLRIKPSELQAYASELVSCGICEISNTACYSLANTLADGLDSFWDDSSSIRAENLFCQPLRGKTLPLKNFDIPPDEIAHVKALLESEEASVHILLYGSPGTGKTTFARSLARELNLKAWTVPCIGGGRGEDDDNRRAKLAACLNMASKHKRAFVLLDEADRFLDTGACYGWWSKDKAWINEFLEQPGRRVIWIVNDIEHIHSSVRRRFTFSICFKPLNCEERRSVWKAVLKEQRAISRLPEEQVKRFARDYPVSPAVMEGAVRQAKSLAGNKTDFAGTAELVLRSYVTLANNGTKPRSKSRLSGEYTLDGVCLEGSVDEFLGQCRRIDAMMREEKPVRPGGATMLFYGPPGSGKSALAKYLADELERELVVRRASDLLSPFVGMSEYLVAEAFREAERSILVIDEVDSFLYSRESSAHSWENTLVNEFLTALEECCGFCVCTTNRMKDMDAAAMRRFSLKMAFCYAGREQVMALYKSLLAPLADGNLPESVEAELSRLRNLAPGDFHTVKSQYWLAERGTVSHEKLIESLAREESLKRDGQIRRIGF